MVTAVAERWNWKLYFVDKFQFDLKLCMLVTYITHGGVLQVQKLAPIPNRQTVKPAVIQKAVPADSTSNYLVPASRFIIPLVTK